ncbi:MAG TPA: class I SAM-dependent methyltransferase [Methylomirabilota bacterium]|nr:class I SAM-dependent methyltransferase [Methylomirabilota bacterium]
MNDTLKLESERLERSWMRHDAGMLRDYLVASVEDPRINLQSILSRHFLVQAVAGEKWAALQQQEYRFSAAVNWLAALATRVGNREDLDEVLYALRQGADNSEGLEIPPFLSQTFRALPATTDGLVIPNYIESLLLRTTFKDGRPDLDPASLDTFQGLWSQALIRPAKDAASGEVAAKFSLLEPACGSANDYRFLRAYGLADAFEYTGFDLCEKNIDNARALFPGACFRQGNVFEIGAEPQSYQLSFTHDLFEHLSAEGIEAAVRELCRVTRWSIAVGFFNMDEIPEHILRPVEDYHWNMLSVKRMKQVFAEHGFIGQVIHIGTFLRQRVGCGLTHNPNAHTFVLHRGDRKRET